MLSDDMCTMRIDIQEFLDPNSKRVNISHYDGNPEIIEKLREIQLLMLRIQIWQDAGLEEYPEQISYDDLEEYNAL